jgi:hypothetical protein
VTDGRVAEVPSQLPAGCHVINWQTVNGFCWAFDSARPDAVAAFKAPFLIYLGFFVIECDRIAGAKQNANSAADAFYLVYYQKFTPILLETGHKATACCLVLYLRRKTDGCNLPASKLF